MLDETQIQRMIRENSDASIGNNRPPEKPRRKLGKKVAAVTVESALDQNPIPVEIPEIERTGGHGSFA